MKLKAREIVMKLNTTTLPDCSWSEKYLWKIYFGWTKTRRLNHDYIGAKKETLRGYTQSAYIWKPNYVLIYSIICFFIGAAIWHDKYDKIKQLQSKITAVH